ncbi:uncharacterized protein BT62DRAFT_926539 [Guyanagaster necrorhizus]|uniref:Homeobox domain-containing protein n=1 Tax=Guyanagaster necrorhizus TaxID=856835 RepID=A0A9P7W470_9AGAR|nr:uncharacterized protein BT62DRAFT_926539 [Guyanagaster necrorhizus MCA 3950]KAG7452338.1 hypothetical protein BT62DRAFT_926539 [Guyanagaster necrorhizus MCA 3950]
MQLRSSARQDVLQNIVRVAQIIRSIGADRFLASHDIISPSISPSLALQLPDDVKLELSNDRVPATLRNSLTTAVGELQAQYSLVYEQTLHQTMSVPGPRLFHLQQLGSLFQDVFATQTLPDLMGRYIRAKNTMMSRLKDAAQRQERETRPQFNTNHTPLLLMIYTHHTPYPTAAERLAIAEYTHMSERQIEVWFQNHRRVQKKAGFPPSRTRGPSGSVERLLTSLPSPSYSQPTPEPEQHPDDDPEKKYISLTRPAFSGALSSESIPVPTPNDYKGKGREVSPSFLRPLPYPAHAFHFQVPWPRAPPTIPTTMKPTPPTMDDLTHMFARMNVHAPPQEHKGEAATARYTTDLRGHSAAYVGEDAWKSWSWSWSWHGRTGLLSVEWGKNSWATRRKSRTIWKPYLKPQQPSRSSSRRTPSRGSSSSSSPSSRITSWGSQIDSSASSYTSYSPSPSPPPGFVPVT